MNHLASETSPYLLQHANNPVDWYPWGETALAIAKLEDKPIFLSIGYAACHWCHVMERESFTDPVIAGFLNEHFISIKVDREERPDLDDLYMQAVMALTGSGGWPMTVFLTPELEPFYGGTYFPPVRTRGTPSFLEVLHGIQQLWQGDRQKVATFSAQMLDYLNKSQRHYDEGQQAATTLDLEKLVASLSSTYDWKFSGWGSAPKFPQHMTLQFLLTRAAYGDQTAWQIARHNLAAMSAGGLYDLAGGGFHRYSTNNTWLIPHFEKMLYDNALLAQNYLYGYLISGDPWLRHVLEGTLAFCARELRHPAGGFYSSLDADSEGHEGLFYTWSEEEFNELLAAYPKAKALLETRQPQFESRYVPRLLRQPDTADLDMLKPALDVLLDARAGRVRPPTDDKIITSWNGLMLTAYAEAARFLGHQAYLETAQALASFLLAELYDSKVVYRSWREGAARQPGFLEDYASLALGLLALYQADFDSRWFAAAREIFQLIPEKFAQDGKLFDSASADLLVRPLNVMDNATPSGMALYARLALTMQALNDDQTWDQLIAPYFNHNASLIQQHPTSFGFWLHSGLMLEQPIDTCCLILPAESADPDEFFSSLRREFRPSLLLAAGVEGAADLPVILRDKPTVSGGVTAYLCRGATCLPPQTTAEGMLRQLSGLQILG